MTYRVVAHLQQKAISVSAACRVLQVSRSGYYAHQRAQPGPRHLREQTHVKAVFAASGASYGSRRVMHAVRAQGLRMGRYRVRTLMREAGLHVLWKRKFVATTNSKHALPVAPNVLERRFDVCEPNRAWVSDISYIRTAQGWLYLAVVLELYSRKVIGWCDGTDDARGVSDVSLEHGAATTPSGTGTHFAFGSRQSVCER